LTTIIDAKGSRTEFVHNAKGDVVVVRHPDAGETRRVYAADGKKVYERDGHGTEWWYGYDALGRVVQEIPGADPLAAARIVYSYDAPAPLGRTQLFEVRNVATNDRKRFYYDELRQTNRVESMLAGAVVSDDRATYNDLDEVKRRDFQDGTAMEYDYGVDGGVRAIRFVRADGTPVPMVEQVVYHPSGRIGQARLAGGGVVYGAAFDPSTQRLTSRTFVDGGGATCFSLDQLAYDRVGNVRGYREDAPAAAPVLWALEYDSLYRVRHATATQAGAGLFDREYRYDAVGNFLRNDEFSPGDTLAYGVARPDAVLGTTANPNLFTYDGAGRATTTPQLPVVRWNDRKRVDRLANAGGDQIDITYTHDGALVELIRTAGGVADTSRFISPAHEQHGGQDRYFAVLEGVQWVSTRPDGVRTVFARSLGNSIVRVIDQAGATVAGTDEMFGPFGATVGAAPLTPAPRGFADAIRGSNGVQLMGARPFHSGLGRFLSPDPILLARVGEDLLLSPPRLSPYSYALNNPRGFVDPSGELVLVDDALFWIIGRLTGARSDGPIGIIDNFIESWKLVGGTFWTFHDAKSAGDIAFGVLELFLRLTWSLPNEIAGILAGYFAIEIAGGKTRLFENVQIIDTPKTAAFTLGSKVIGTADYKHEQAHYYQSLLCGPTFIALVGIPSVVHFWIWEAAGRPWNYESFPTEAWAEAWK
jgi:RHS repeat-associated protein